MPLTQQPIFSIICPDYDGAVTQHRRYSAIASVLKQSFPDWELLVIHDGPRRFSVEANFKDTRINWLETDIRHNDWGHSLRDIGLKQAKGDYIIHLNADNELYTHCLAILYAYSRRKPIITRLSRGILVEETRVNPQVLIFGIRMMGCLNPSHKIDILRRPGKELEQQQILPGWPPRPQKIDAMQLVAKKSIWHDIGGWFDKTKDSDGLIYEKICQRFGYLVIPEILGEHW